MGFYSIHLGPIASLLPMDFLGWVNLKFIDLVFVGVFEPTMKCHPKLEAHDEILLLLLEEIVAIVTQL